MKARGGDVEKENKRLQESRSVYDFFYERLFLNAMLILYRPLQNCVLFILFILYGCACSGASHQEKVKGIAQLVDKRNGHTRYIKKLIYVVFVDHVCC